MTDLPEGWVCACPEHNYFGHGMCPDCKQRGSTMKQPTREQLRDPDWWDREAPEWAKSYGTAGALAIPVWFNLKQYQHVRGVQAHRVFEFESGGCFELGDITKVASRPTNPAAPEWDGEGEIKPGQAAYHTLRGENVTIVGHDYTKEVPLPMFYADNRYWATEPEWLKPTKAKAERERDGEWPPVGAECDYVIGDDRYPVTVVAHFDGEIVVFQHESAPAYTGVQPGYLQPRKTQAEQDLDELATEIWGAVGGTKEQAYHAANRVIAAGWCKGE